MVTIVLNESQILAMEAETKKMEKAHRELKPGALIFQVFPRAKIMEGKFIPKHTAAKVHKSLHQKQGFRIFR